MRESRALTDMKALWTTLGLKSRVSYILYVSYIGRRFVEKDVFPYALLCGGSRRPQRRCGSAAAAPRPGCRQGVGLRPLQPLSGPRLRGEIKKRALTRSVSSEDDEDIGNSTWRRPNLRRCHQSRKEKKGLCTMLPLSACTALFLSCRGLPSKFCSLQKIYTTHIQIHTIYLYINRLSKVSPRP